VLGIVTMGAAVPVIAMAGAGLLGAGIGIGMTEIQDLSDNGTIDYGFNTYAGAAAGGFVAGATLPYSAGAGLAGIMGAGALSSMAGNATNQMISTGKINASQFAIAGVTGALTCGIASMAPQTVSIVGQGIKSLSSKLTASSANATVNAAEAATAKVTGNVENSVLDELVLNNPADDLMNAGSSGIKVVEGEIKTEIVLPNKPHTNGTDGHWETILDKIDSMANTGEYKIIYSNKGLSNEISGAIPNRRPDIMGVRQDGIIDQFEIPSKTDDPAALLERMLENQKILGERAGSVQVVPIKKLEA